MAPWVSVENTDEALTVTSMALVTPPHQPLYVPGTNERVLRRPDLRFLNRQRLSGVPMYNEIDYDDLVVHRSWRSYDQDAPDQVRYFMYELSQRNPGETEFSPVFFKALRFVRLTRVPRYLRQASSASGPNLVFEQMRDVLVALRERGVLFNNVIAKSPQLPLIFAYGVQGIGNTPEEAMQLADEAYAVLDFQLTGTYQQLMYKPLSIDEGEVLARYQQEWGHIAMARGRPLPASGTLGTSSLLDGNRTDVESASNQLESFIRGMSDRSFILSLVTVPLSPVEIRVAWRNINQKLSEVRSETTGTRAVNAGIAFPLIVGSSEGASAGTTHSSGSGIGHSASEGVNTSQNTGISDTLTHGSASSRTDTSGITDTVGVNAGTSQSSTVGTNQSVTETQGVSQSMSVTETQGVNQSMSVTETQGVNQSMSVTETQGVNSSQSLAAGNTVGTNTSSTSGNTFTEGSTNTSGSSFGTSAGTSSGSSSESGSSSNVGGGIPGVASGGNGSSSSSGWAAGENTGMSSGTSQSTANSSSNASSNSSTSGASQSQSLTATNSVGTSQSIAVGQSVGTSQSVAVGQTVGTSQSVGVTTGASQSSTVGTSQGTSESRAASNSVASGNTLSQSSARATSASEGSGTNRSTGTSEDFSSAYAVAMGRTNTTSGSLAVAPSFGVSVSRNTFDAAKQYIGDLLETQARRYSEGIKSGAFLYQMFLVCPDRETLVGGAGLMKSAFWGAGDGADQLPSPFHTIVDFEDEEERKRLLVHARALTSYRKREESIELIEPFRYSSYLTPTEAAAFTHPPVVEGPGLLAVHDSMPVLRIPMDRQNRDIFLGYVVNGERGAVSGIRFGIDLDEMTHTLVAGVTGSGKTTTLMRMIAEAVRIERTVIETPTAQNPTPVARTVRASILALDWMRNMRDLAAMPDLVNSGRFRFYSVLKPELGAFRWNPLEVPAEGMNASEWLNAQADNFTASFNLGEFGRSLIAEFLTELYSANRLVEYTLRPEVIDESTGQVMRSAVVLPRIPREQIPNSAIQVDALGREIANVFTHPQLSRTVGMSHLAILVAAAIERAATVEGARLMGQQMRDRLQSLWRRMSYFAPNGQYARMLGADPDLVTRTSLSVTDLIDPDRGLVTVVETDGLDFEARRLILGSVMLAIYRYGLHHGKGVFDHNGKGPGCFVVLEESHELFGEQVSNEDSYSASTRTALYEGMFRRVRALGLRLVAVAQQPSALPDSVTANINNVFIHKVRAKEDRDKAFSLLNWAATAIGGQLREWRYLGEMPTGYCIARLDARVDYTESAPVQFLTEPAVLHEVSDAELAELANRYRG